MSAPVTDKQHGFRRNRRFVNTELEECYTTNCRKYYVCRCVCSGFVGIYIEGFLILSHDITRLWSNILCYDRYSYY